jgi:hypothetical protein
MDDIVLERNICFIDTPGYDAGMSVVEGMELVTRYVTTQMSKTIPANTLGDDELLGILGGGGGLHVDVAFYLIDQGRGRRPLTHLSIRVLTPLPFQNSGRRMSTLYLGYHG